VKGGWREEGERVKELARRSVNPIPNLGPDPNPKQALQMWMKEADLKMQFSRRMVALTKG
jgi:hypothetical protein